MNNASTVLTDVANGIWLDKWAIDANSGLTMAGSAEWAIRKQTLRGGVSDGVDVIEIDNGVLTMRLLPTRGMGLWNAEFAGRSIGWKSPVARPVNPAFVNQESRGRLGWLSGFNELLCRCGLASNGPPEVDEHNEQPLSLHGLIANTPAHYVEVHVDDNGPGTISVAGIVDETSMFGSQLQLKSTLTTQAGSNRLTIVDEITNLSSGPAEVELLYHTNLGQPLLEAGSRAIIPVREMAPRNARAAEGLADWSDFGPPELGFAEQVYFVIPAADENGDTIAMLKNAAGDFGVSLSFNVGQLPCFSLWKNTQLYANGYVTGLEPSTDFPNPRSFERSQGRLLTLPAGESYVTELQITGHDRSDAVADIERKIESIQAGVSPTIHSAPQPQFSPSDD